MRKMRCPSAWFGLLILVPLGAQMLASVAGAGDTPGRGPLPGQIVIDPEHPQWLMRQGGAHLFICGPGDPEDFLYIGTRNPDGTRDGDQVQRIRKLIEQGGNCIYMQIVRTHGGDARPDRTQNPFVDSDPAQGVDPDILDQWEQWFTLMDRHDILIYLFFYDDGARPWDTGARVGPAERAFLETIVKRFQHHRNLIWIVGEESEERYSTARVQAIAAVIRQADEHGHLIGNHHLSGTTFKAWRPEGALNHFAMQLSATDDAAHAGAVEAWQKAAGRYQVIYAESTAMRTDEEGMRRHAWAVAMGGLMPMFLRMDVASTPVESLRQCRYLQRFFEATDFYRMAPHEELKYGETRYVLGDPGRSYIAYADDLVGKLGVKDLPAGRCEVTWLDCCSGRTAEERHTLAHAGDHAFDKPPDFGPECAAWIRFPDRESSSWARAPSTTAGPVSSDNHPLAVEWLDPRSGDTTQGQSTLGGEKRPFQPPLAADAVLHLRSIGPQNDASTGRPPASPILAQAARGVEVHRKGDATVRFVRKDGTDASGLKVEVAQRTHDFAFGNIFRPRHYANETYRARFLELFNFVQLLEFNWGQYETEEGKPKLADRMEFINGWCREHGLTRFYGHMLVWSPQNNSPDRPNIPHWLFRYDRPAQDRLLKERIQREVLAYRDVDILWDVVNEAVHCRRWGDWEKQGYMDEPIPDVVPYVRDAFRWAHEANRQAPLLLNDYRVISQGKYRDRYIELIERLQKEETPVHAIGIQAHEPYKGAYWFSPEEIWQTCEQFGTQTGLPVHFTEFCYLSDPAQDIRGTHRQGKWDPQKQADAIEEFYRIAFGHPAVASITYFGMGDDDPPWLPNLCLLDKGFQPKPAWNRLKKLIKEEWNTHQSGRTDAAGVYRFRGFFGQYDVRVTDGEKQQTFAVHLEKGEPNVWNFTLDR